MSDKILDRKKMKNEMLESYRFWYVKYMKLHKQYYDSKDAWTQSKFHSLQLRDKVLDPDSNILNLIETDEKLIDYYLNAMSTDLGKILTDLQKLYDFTQVESKEAYENFKEIEMNVTKLIETVLLLESRYKKRRQGFVLRCADLSLR